MKNIHNYIMVFVMAFAVASCADDEVIDNKNQAKPGDDVQFGLSLPNSRTVSRTVYGTENTEDYGTENTEDDITFLPVYWVDGDKVQIYSPECAAGRNDAEYSVTPKSGQSYAEKLTKTGEYGVQWGNEDKANFYSVYPSLNAEFSGSGDDVTAKLNISSTQNANLSAGGATDMDNVIMYAQTNGVEAGSTVNLNYTPYSTILQFKLTLGGSNNGWGKVKVSSLTLTAPEEVAIAGDFNLKFANGNAPTISAAGNNSNSITVSFETAPILSESNQTTNINVALIPLSSVKNLTGWTVSLDVYENDDTEVTTYTLNLDGASNLMAGMIHKITLPAITPDVAWEYDLENWISSLYDYKNIYLTELSLPGAWYAGAPTSDGYQATADITTLFNNGIRAFAVECRTSSTRSGISYNPSSVVISGTQSNGLLGSYCTGGTRISTVISSIAEAVNGTNEFGVLVLSYADGGTDGHRTQDHAFFIKGIKAEIEASGATNVIFSEDDGVTNETIVEEVLGKLVILVNVDYELSKSSYENDMNALLTYVPHVDHLSYHLAEGETAVDFSKIRFSPMYWKSWSDNYKVTPLTTTTTDNLYLCFASANRTQADSGKDTSIPTYEQRKTALRSMITHSHEISKAGNHNVWFYFNVGGTQTTSQTSGSTSGTTYADTMNKWLLEVINLKSNGGVDTNGYYTGKKGTIVMSDPSPLGIVLFNQCTNGTYKGPDIVKAIIDMNDKFKLQRYNPNPDPDNGSGGGGTPF